jgi:hypothetical protein
MAELLAVDLGLRMGLAWYRSDGTLRAYRSQHVPNRSVLRRAAFGMLREADDLSHLYLEGGGALESIWAKEGAKVGARVRSIQAGVWRRDLLLPRQRRSGRDAKQEADTLAREVIAWSGAPKPTSLRHDAAEAILVGLWGVIQTGWLNAWPPR